MKFSRLLLFTIVAALPGIASANLVFNGSFENNTATTTMYNLTNAQANATINDVRSIGIPGSLDLMQDSSNNYGSPAAHGQWKVGMTDNDRISLLMSETLVVGHLYNLTFFAQAVRDFNAGTGPIYIGLGDINGLNYEFYSTGNNINSTGWQSFSVEFVALYAATRVYVRSTGGTWSHIDDINVSNVVPEPGTLAIFGLAGAAYRVCRSRRSRR
jgi:hypothetical protein